MHSSENPYWRREHKMVSTGHFIEHNDDLFSRKGWEPLPQ